MGQLEKYGLYVLCLVIFLILGVTIWGGGDVPPPRRTATTTGLNATASVAEPGRTVSEVAKAPDLDALLRPAPRPQITTPANQVRPGGQPAAVPTENVRTGDLLNAGAGNDADNDPGRGGADDAASAPPAVQRTATPAVQRTEPPPAARRTYKVQRGDSFDSIARRLLGSASRRTDIARLNPSVRPERMQVGSVLVLPDDVRPGAPAETATPVEASAPRAGGVVAYTIAKGDTLEGIARRQLGDRRRVRELRELNPDIEPTRLRIGDRIQLPRQ